MGNGVRMSGERDTYRGYRSWDSVQREMRQQSVTKSCFFLNIIIAII
jgi:hypothetical protein